MDVLVGACNCKMCLKTWVVFQVGLLDNNGTLTAVDSQYLQKQGE